MYVIKMNDMYYCYVVEKDDWSEYCTLKRGFKKDLVNENDMEYINREEITCGPVIFEDYVSANYYLNENAERFMRNFKFFDMDDVELVFIGEGCGN